jgi:hypothetical protein
MFSCSVSHTPHIALLLHCQEKMDGFLGRDQEGLTPCAYN